MSTAIKPKVHIQGKAVIERDDDGFLVMTPDGQVHGAATLCKAQSIVNKWASSNSDSDAINAMMLEIRS